MMRTMLSSLASIVLACSIGASGIALGGCDEHQKSPAAATPSDTKPKDAKPGDAKPADAKPSDAKPTDTKPADAKPVEKLPTTEVIISKKKFTLEVAAEDKARMKGLGSRTEIAENGGMIFVFPPRMVGVHAFIMRDCYVDIDIIYTDGIGRVLSFHEMKKEEPRGHNGKYEGDEGDVDSNAIQDPKRKQGTIDYHNRLKSYSSRYPCTFAIELKAGTIKKLNVQEGDLINFDTAGLKKMAK